MSDRMRNVLEQKMIQAFVTYYGRPVKKILQTDFHTAVGLVNVLETINKRTPTNVRWNNEKNYIGNRKKMSNSWFAKLKRKWRGSHYN